MPVYAVENGGQIGLREAQSPEAARRDAVREIGTANVFNLQVRPATSQDIAWVRAMGGYIPPAARAAATTQTENSHGTSSTADHH